MPPRIPLLQCLRFGGSSQPASSPRNFTSTPNTQASTVAQRKRNRDPWALAQAKARKAANLSRQEVLKKQRVAAAGDHVRGTLTPLVQSFDTALPVRPEPADAFTANEARSEETEHLNFYLAPAEFEQGLEHSKRLLAPKTQWSTLLDQQQKNTAAEEGAEPKAWGRYAPTQEDNYVPDEPHIAETDNRLLELTASEALRRITSISTGSSKDRLRVNKARLIETFGRHSTDLQLPPPLRAHMEDEADTTSDQRQPGKTPRVGPDTGSSEVQIAILTAKIKTVADFLQQRGKNDKHNKRNLRLLVHRRAKLMKYLRRKERGGPRWQNLVEKLGLTDAMWKGEITM